MSAIQYEDVHEHKWDGYYAVPNENTLAWRELIKNTPIYRAAAVCSSGEVGLFGILPLVRRELVLIDHSYRSLHVAAMKYLLLREKGAKETYRLCTANDPKELQEAIAKFKDTLPDKLGSCFENGHWLAPTPPRDPNIDAYGYDRRTGRYVGVGARLAGATGHSSAWGNAKDDAAAVKRVWNKIPLEVVAKACEKLHRVKFLHGDMTDLARDGGFGLIYLSNALQHNYDRNKTGSYYSSIITAAQAKQFEQIEAALRPGGYVLLAHTESKYGGNKKFEDRGWKLVSEKDAHATMNWDQQLWQVKAA